MLGGPGTGKSSLLVDAAVAAIGGGVDPESVLLLTGSGRIRDTGAQHVDKALLRSGGDDPAASRFASHWSAPCTGTPTPSAPGRRAGR